jgi:hypothetical protein
MTLHQLLNTCNAHPDIEITVYSAENSFHPEFAYEGKYEDLNPIYYNRTVSHFSVDKLHNPGYNIFIDHMTIYLSREEN